MVLDGKVATNRMPATAIFRFARASSRLSGSPSKKAPVATGSHEFAHERRPVFFHGLADGPEVTRI
jgi:hypothetical protein